MKQVSFLRTRFAKKISAHTRLHESVPTPCYNAAKQQLTTYSCNSGTKSLYEVDIQHTCTSIAPFFYDEKLILNLSQRVPIITSITTLVTSITSTATKSFPYHYHYHINSPYHQHLVHNSPYQCSPYH